MLANPCGEIQTSEEPRPAVPPWFAEVVIIVQCLATKGILSAFARQMRLIRGRFGRYEPIDFLALLLGYAISGERTLEAFFVQVAPLRLNVHGPLWTPLLSASGQFKPLVSRC